MLTAEELHPGDIIVRRFNDGTTRRRRWTGEPRPGRAGWITPRLAMRGDTVVDEHSWISEGDLLSYELEHRGLVLPMVVAEPEMLRPGDVLEWAGDRWTVTGVVGDRVNTDPGSFFTFGSFENGDITLVERGDTPEEVKPPDEESGGETTDAITDAHRQDMDVLARELLEEARRRGWCGDYESFLRRVNPMLTVPIDGERYRNLRTWATYEVTFERTDHDVGVDPVEWRRQVLLDVDLPAPPGWRIVTHRRTDSGHETVAR
jgi:hypothetical protein